MLITIRKRLEQKRQNIIQNIHYIVIIRNSDSCEEKSNENGGESKKMYSTFPLQFGFRPSLFDGKVVVKSK